MCTLNNNVTSGFRISASGTYLIELCLCIMQVDDTEVINFLLSTEIIPLCLKTMEMGSELSKTVATFIVQKILLDNVSPDHSSSHPL